MKAASTCAAAVLLVLVGCGGTGGEIGQGIGSPGGPGSEPGTASGPALSGGAAKQTITQLSATEYAETVNVLLGVSVAAQSAPSTGGSTAGGFVTGQASADQMAQAYYSSAVAIATTATSASNLTNLLQDANCTAPAANSGSAGAACATAFINEFAPLAFRKRTLDAATLANLSGVYTAVAVTQGAGFSQGVAAVLEEILQSPYFIYRGLPTG